MFFFFFDDLLVWTWLALPLTSSFPLCPGEHCSLLLLSFFSYCCCFPDPHLPVAALSAPVISPLRGTFSEPPEEMSVFNSICLLWTCLPFTLLRTMTIKVVTNFTSAVFVPVTTHYTRHHFTKSISLIVLNVVPIKQLLVQKSCPMEKLFGYLIAGRSFKRLFWNVKLNQSRRPKEVYSS